MPFGVHDSPFYRPLWRRVAIVVVTFLWAAFEITMGQEELWVVVASATFLYSAWAFLLNYKAPPEA